MKQYQQISALKNNQSADTANSRDNSLLIAENLRLRREIALLLLEQRRQARLLRRQNPLAN